MQAAFHLHSIDLTACGHPQLLAKLSYAAYGKLAELHRRNAPAGEPTASGGGDKEGTGGAAAALCAERDMWEREGRAAAAAVPSAGREALHERMFAMLLRYKCIRGHGFQMAVGPAVFGVLESWLGTGMELFASPLNCHWGRFCSAFPDVEVSLRPLLLVMAASWAGRSASPLVGWSALPSWPRRGTRRVGRNRRIADSGRSRP